jgi:Domain of unknown function (DUF4384)
MRSFESMLGRCLGALVLSAGCAAAGSSPAALSGIAAAMTPSLERAATPQTPPVPSLVMVAQNASDRVSAPADLPNAANLSLQMSPDSAEIGTKVSFRITTKKPGYLLLVDIDAFGRMTQIFPNPEMLVQSQEAATNFIKPGEEMLIPNSTAKKLGFEYVMAPPHGTAAMVAILSDRRVQILDLPDNAQKKRSEAETISYLAGWTSGLRVPDAGTGKLQPSNWSFAIKQYSIR